MQQYTPTEVNPYLYLKMFLSIMRERVTVVILSLCLSDRHFLILEKALFSGLKLHQYILYDNLSPLNVALFSYFGEKASGTLALTAVIYAGTAQSLNGLAREFLACELLALTMTKQGILQR